MESHEMKFSSFVFSLIIFMNNPLSLFEATSVEFDSKYCFMFMRSLRIIL